MCRLVVGQVFSVAFEEAMLWCACALMVTGYCVLVHATVCSVQRILPDSWCAYMHNAAPMAVKQCIGFGSCSVAH